MTRPNPARPERGLKNWQGPLRGSGHGPGPGISDDLAEYWLGRIHRLRNTRVGVPNDEEVREGIRARQAYGGSATRSSFAVLAR